MSLLSKLFGGSEQPDPATAAPVRLQGPGTFAVDAVGESNYQEAFEAICGPRHKDGEDRLVEAALVLENTNPYDPEAVRIDVAARTVGYLSRPAAPTYRAYLAATARSTSTAYCAARIRGGWERSRSNRGHYGIKLDLPAP